MFDIALNHEAKIFTRAADPLAYTEFGKFRKQLFIDKLSWKLRQRNGSEFDEFDNKHAHYLILMYRGKITAGFRAIQCDKTYLASSKFPELAIDRSYPDTKTSWEITRLGIDPDIAPRATGLILYALLFKFARLQAANRLVAFTTLAHEKHLDKLGIRTKRYGPPACIGTDTFGRKMVVVAGEIDLRDQCNSKHQKLLDLAERIHFTDETQVFRHSSISA
ncbi:MAG: acyl-homoserine-lactone synthase [Anderseniella sp.]